jgi:DEAD/DEAH box helicase domain-containing protein
MKRPILVFDIETRRLFDEIHGGRITDLGFACAVVRDLESEVNHYFVQRSEGWDQAVGLHQLLGTARLVVGFNHERFDFRVCEGAGVSFKGMPSFDIMGDVQRRTKKMYSLENMARASLGRGKSGKGELAPMMWRKGQVDEVVRYCADDVKLTADLFMFGLEHGKIGIDQGGLKRFVHTPWRAHPVVGPAVTVPSTAPTP